MLKYHNKFYKCTVLLFSLFIAMSFACNAVAQGRLTTLAQKYYYGKGVSKNIHKAFTLYLRAAQTGDTDAMFIVGGMYMQGQGTVVNTTKAFNWLYAAAMNGKSSKESERILGQAFIKGRNVPQDYDEALRWYGLAAKGGDAEAQSELAFLYFSGKHIKKDYKKAHHWFKIAAMNNYSLAQYNMGILWYTGNGVSTIDYGRAYAWFNLAAANGHRNAEGAKKSLETTLSPDELSKAQKISTKLYHTIKSNTHKARSLSEKRHFSPN